MEPPPKNSRFATLSTMEKTKLLENKDSPNTKLSKNMDEMYSKHVYKVYKVSLIYQYIEHIIIHILPCL
jgi:hypothetical protein